MKPDVFDKIGPGYGDNLMAHYDYMRRHDIYAAYAVLPPAGARNPEFYQKKEMPVPTLKVVEERDDGVVISGMKMLATGRCNMPMSCGSETCSPSPMAAKLKP